MVAKVAFSSSTVRTVFGKGRVHGNFQEKMFVLSILISRNNI